MIQKDVAILYRAQMAKSALNPEYDGKTPFPNEGKYKEYNRSYAQLINELKAKNLSPVFTSTDDILGSGRFKSFWVFKGNQWKRKREAVKVPILFDKFTPNNTEEENLLKQASQCSCVQTYNSSFITKLFGDKLKTYEALPQHSIPTVAVHALNKEALIRSKLALKKLLNKNPKKIIQKGILKDRSGAGGYGIHKINLESINVERIQSLQKADQKEKDELNYVLQPFIDCKGKLKKDGKQQIMDIRIIFCGQDVQQCYIRTAAKGDFRCNTHQGGDIRYLDLQKIPIPVKQKAKKILAFLHQKVNLRHHLFALDFVLTPAGKVYLMEGNSNPGITWTEGNQEDEKHTKELIKIISKGLRKMVDEQEKLYCKTCS